jgi:hypothetical protein
LQKAYGVLDAYGLPRNYFVETKHDDCEVASEAPDIVPSNTIPDNATRTPSVLGIVTPAKENPSEPSDDTSKKPTNGEKLAEDEALLESAESPSTVEDVPKAPSETTQDNTSSETIVTPGTMKEGKV